MDDVKTQWTIVLDFYGGLNYPILLDPGLRHDGALKAEILRLLQHKFVDPLPNPKDIRLTTAGGETIDSDGLFERTLAAYFPEGAERVIHVGRTGGAISLPGLDKVAAKKFLERVGWKVSL